MIMMNDLLERYDKRTAAGVLARAALLAANGEPTGTKSIVENEPALWSALIEQARAKLGFKPEDKSPEVFERIGSYLDDESERLIGGTDTTAAFERLIRRGEFPSDLYKIRIIPNIKVFFGKDFDREKSLIERTVRLPTKEQHFGGSPQNRNVPQLVSLFAREFKTPYPAKNFTMLVTGKRGDKNILEVHQAWRVYASQVNMFGARDLVELLRRFADVYGYDILVDGQRGRFFLVSSGFVPASTEIQVQIGGKLQSKNVTVTRFTQLDPDTGKTQAALVMAVDLDLYRKTLEHWDFKQIR